MGEGSISDYASSLEKRSESEADKRGVLLNCPIGYIKFKTKKTYIPIIIWGSVGIYYLLGYYLGCYLLGVYIGVGAYGPIWTLRNVT
jgi:hypothetical protein